METKLFIFYLFHLIVTVCSVSVDIASFYGNSYIHLPFKEAKSTTDIHFKFRTHLANGLILLVAGSTDYCIVRLENARIKININLGAGESELVSSQSKLNDLKWHNVSIIRKEANLSLVVDSKYKVEKLLPGRFFELNIHYGLFTGGQGNFSEIFFGHLDKFRGCLSDVKYNNLKVLEQARLRLSPSTVESITWNCGHEFEAKRDRPISFIEDNAYMLISQIQSYKEFNLKFDLKTIETNGIIFFNGGHSMNSDYLVVQIVNKLIQCVLKVGTNVIQLVNNKIVSNGDWHSITLVISRTTMEINVDSTNAHVEKGFQLFQWGDSSYFGSIELSKRSRAMLSGCTSCDQSFKGCLNRLSINDQKIGLPDALTTEGLLPECRWQYPCHKAQKPCKPEAKCTHQGIDSFQCICTQQNCINDNFTDTYKVFTALATDLEILSVTPLDVIEGGSSIITISNLHIILDYQKYGILDSGIRFNVVNGPSHATLTIDKIYNPTIEYFLLQDVLLDKVHYVHDGSEYGHDSIVLQVSFTTKDHYILPAYLQGQFTFSLNVNVISVNDRPIVDIGNKTVLRVVQGSKTLVTKDIFNVNDPDSKADELIYTILKSESGYFENKQGSKTTTFTQQNINDRLIYFIHRATSANESFIKYEVSDGKDTSPQVKLRISVTPQYWILKNNTGITVLHQTSGLITAANLSFSTNVANADYKAQFRIVKKPHFGTIEVERSANNWKSSEVFTSSDLKQHRVRYRHVLSKPDFDEFQFETTLDRSETHTFRVTFVKCSLEEENLKPVFMNETQEMVISQQSLSFQTKPVKTLTTSIRYVITRQPKYGILVSTLSKYTLKTCDTFTQEDILSSNIKYKLFQQSYSYVQDTFSFVVFSPGCNNMTRNMTIVYYPSLKTKSKVNALLHTLKIDEGSSKKIDTDHITFDDYLTNLTFNVTQEPQHGILQTITNGVHNNHTTFFTRKHLENNQLYYIHDDSETNSDTFEFLALSKESNFQYVGKFNINIIMKNDNSPVRVIDKVFDVVVGGERILTGDNLKFVDIDLGTKPTDIVYTCRDVANGFFSNKNNPMTSVTEFTQDDLDNFRILFKHKGAEYGKVRLWVTDGQFHVNGILEIQASAPFIHIVMDKKLIVEYGKSIAITRDHLSYTTNLFIASDQDLVYEIITKPYYGKVVLMENNVTTFTQKDINEGKIVYMNTDRVTSANGDEIGIRARCKDAIAVSQIGIWMLPSNYWEPFTIKGSKMLSVEESTSSLLVKKVLEITQRNVPPASITYYISELPTNGYLTILSTNNTNDEPILSFTQDLINEQRVLYIQTSANKTCDSIRFNITNGIIWYNDLLLSIEIIPERLYLSSNNLTVPEGGQSLITTTNLAVLTDYYKNKITDYVILQEATHGCVQIHGRCNKFSGFSHKELVNNVVAYSNDGTENSHDKVTLVAVAGQKRSIPVTLYIQVKPVNDQIPKVVNNTGMTMWEGGLQIIDSSMLATIDNDQPSETLTYIVLSSWWGNLVHVSDISNSITNFTQDMVNKCQIAFKHKNGSEAKFKFNVTDGVHITKEYNFFIKTQKALLHLESKPLHIFPLQKKYITRQHLQGNASDRSRSVRYEIIKVPTLGRLMIENRTASNFKVVTTFTQEDIDNNVILYEHTHQFTDLYANDSFTFNVRCHMAKPLLNQVLKIDISVSSGGLGNYITLPNVTVDEGGITNIPLNLSEVVGFLEHHAGIRSPIIHASVNRPKHGRVYLKNDTSTKTMFTQSQLETGLLFYEHDHSDSLNDTIRLALYLLPGYVTLCNLSLTIYINPINDQPFYLSTPAPNLTVVEGENHTITRLELCTEDADTPPSKLKYDVISGPTQGRLVLLPDVTQSVMYFTQADIDHNKLVYMHNSTAALTDSFHFRVWDDKFRPQFTLFNIQVHPVRLEVSVKSPLYIQQGSDVVFLSEKHFQIETNANKLKIMYSVTQEPRHGLLYVRNKPALTFSQRDLVEADTVMYLQSDMTSANDSIQLNASISGSLVEDLVLNIKVQPLMQMHNISAATGEYNKITLHHLDASPLQKLTNTNPRYTVLELPKHCKVRKVIRSSGEKRNIVLDTLVSSFTHEEIRSGVIYLTVESVELPYYGIESRLVFQLAAAIFQPAIGELSVHIRDAALHNDVLSTLSGPNDPAGHEGGFQVASPNITRDYLLIVSMVVGVVILGVAVIVVIKCNALNIKEDEYDEKDDVMVLPRPPERLMSDRSRIEEFGTELATLPQCKITPLNDSQHGGSYPYGPDHLDEWMSCDNSESPLPSKTNIMLRRNQYWV